MKSEKPISSEGTTSKDQAGNAFSFLAQMGREAVESGSQKNCSRKPVFNSALKERTEASKNAALNTINAIKAALMSGNVGETSEMFDVDLEELRSVACSFRQHKIEHIRSAWPKARKNFVMAYKKQRKNAVKAQKAKSVGGRTSNKAPADS